jgi:hypothetical protein
MKLNNPSIEAIMILGLLLLGFMQLVNWLIPTP